jgi:plastocyanin
MRFRYALLCLPAALLVVSSATAAAPKAASMVNISVSNGSLHYNQHVVTAKPGLVQINFTNDSTAPHNVSLEHNGEYEFGSTLTIRKSATTSFLTLAKGSYHLYSSVGRDEDKGMAATLVVK